MTAAWHRRAQRKSRIASRRGRGTKTAKRFWKQHLKFCCPQLLPWAADYLRPEQPRPGSHRRGGAAVPRIHRLAPVPGGGAGLPMAPPAQVGTAAGRGRRKGGEGGGTGPGRGRPPWAGGGGARSPLKMAAARGRATGAAAGLGAAGGR